MLQRFSGVSVKRVIDRSRALVPEHAHDWPVLSLFVMGAYANHTEVGEQLFCGPSAVLYRAGAAHRNVAGPEGFEQIEIEFDPAWLGPAAIPDQPVQHWIGGDAGAEARSFARLCGRELSESLLLRATRQFLVGRSRQAQRPAGELAKVVARHLRGDPTLRVSELAKAVGRHPSWLGSTYRRTTGEGLLDTAARLRVERAARLLRETDEPLALIAAESGFCDQSHMNRTFQRVLGRRPSSVRHDRVALRSF